MIKFAKLHILDTSECLQLWVIDGINQFSGDKTSTAQNDGEKKDPTCIPHSKISLIPLHHMSG